MGHLVLSRKKDEAIVIGDHVVVTVISIRGDKVRLGVRCPDEIRVDRQEVRIRMDRGEPRRRDAGTVDPSTDRAEG